MKTLYIDCGMGAAGDMLSAALLELLPGDYTDRLNAMGIPGVEYVREDAVKCGIHGTHLSVLVHGAEEDEHQHHDHHHHDHSNLHGIGHVVDHLHVSDKIKKDILAVYTLIAEAESKVHGVPVDEVHFHEVGALDAVADVAAVCLMLDALGVESVMASPVHVGSGTVRCAHGILPVPAPATANLLLGIPTYSGEIKGELCTPTGAALLRYFVQSFGQQPAMIAEKIGYGMGKKDFPVANCVRMALGTTTTEPESVTELQCNLDDMTGEEMGFATDVLLEAGALDVFTVAVTTKKNRPGWVLHVLTKPCDKEKMVTLLFQHTTTLGVREQTMPRYTLKREIQTVETPYGTVRKKVSSGYGVTKEKYEFDDLAAIAKAQNLSLQAVRKLADEA